MDIPYVVSLFTKCINEEATREGMLKCLAELTDSVAVFEDTKSPAQSAAFAGKDKHDALLQNTSLKANPGIGNREEQPRSVSDRNEDIVVHRLDAVVSDGQASLGTLSLLREDIPFTNEEPMILRMASEFFSIQAAQERKLAKIELKLTGNFVEDLVFSNNTDHDSIISRAKALDYNISRPHRVLIAEAEDGRTTAKKNRQSGAELVGAAQAGLNRYSGGLAVYKGAELIILFRQEPSCDGIGPAKQFAEELIEEAARTHALKLFVGIGSECSALEDYKSSYLAAKKALEIGEFMITEGQVRSFEQFKAHALFLSTIKPNELLKYARDQLGKLLEYDAKHKTEFLKTLQEFLYLRNNVEGTAKSINMSVSGLKYRLKKIEKLLGAELKDNKVSFDLQLALIILQLFGEYRI